MLCYLSLDRSTLHESSAILLNFSPVTLNIKSSQYFVEKMNHINKIAF